MVSNERPDTEGDEAREVARILLDEEAVSINVANPFVYTSGIVSPIYCDLRLLTASPERRGRVVQALVGLISKSCDPSALDVVTCANLLGETSIPGSICLDMV